MNDLRSWWGWGTFDTSTELQPRAQIEALELPILEGSDPRILTPARLLTREQIENTRTDAIVGGYFAIPRSSLLPGQAPAIGDYWRRLEALERLAPSSRARIATTIGAISWPFPTDPAGPRRSRPRPPLNATVRPRGTGTGSSSAPGAGRVITPGSGKPEAPPAAPVRVAVPGAAGAPRGAPRRFAKPFPGLHRSAALPPAPSRPPGDAASVGPADLLVGPDEQIQALAELEELAALLSTMTPEAVGEYLAGSPELIDLLIQLGYLSREQIEAEPPTEIGASCCDDCARADAYEAAGAVRVGDFWSDLGRTVATVDQQFLSPVWEGVKEFVPYGQQFDALHRGRMALLQKVAPDYYPTPSRTEHGGASSTRDAMIRDLQALARAVRREDPRARQTAATMKERAAAGDPEARRRWAAYIAIARDDDRRLEEGRA